MQLKLQREGLEAFTRAEVIEKLALTDQQREHMTSIRQANRPAGPFAPPPSAEAQQKQTKEVLALLTAEQREHWQSLTGKEFQFPAPPNPFAPPLAP